MKKHLDHHPLPLLEVGGEIEVVGFDFTELTKAESTFFLKILLAAYVPVAMTPADIPVIITAPNFTAGEFTLVLAILGTSFQTSTNHSTSTKIS